MTELSLSQMALTMSKTFLGGCDSIVPSALCTGSSRARLEVSVSAKAIIEHESLVESRDNITVNVDQI